MHSNGRLDFISNDWVKIGPDDVHVIDMGILLKIIAYRVKKDT